MAEHVNPVLPPAVHGDMEPSFNRLMKTKLAFLNTFVSVLCGPGVAAPLPAGHAKLPTVSRDAVVFERAAAQVVRGGGAMPARPRTATARRRANRPVAGNAAVRSAIRATSRVRRSRGWRGARGTAGFASGTLKTECAMGRGPANPSCCGVFDVRWMDRCAGGRLRRFNL